MTNIELIKNAMQQAGNYTFSYYYKMKYGRAKMCEIKFNVGDKVKCKNLSGEWEVVREHLPLTKKQEGLFIRTYVVKRISSLPVQNIMYADEMELMEQ